MKEPFNYKEQDFESLKGSENWYSKMIKKPKGYSIEVIIIILEYFVELDMLLDSSALNHNMAQLLWAYEKQEAQR